MKHKFISKKSFSNWTPKIPKNKIVINHYYKRAPHPIWEIKDAEKVSPTHYKPKSTRDKFAFFLAKGLRNFYDMITLYKPGKINELHYLRRCIFLESIAGVPGMIAAVMRHFSSIGTLKEDNGWIHHLLEEAENERMHLLTFLKLRELSEPRYSSIVIKFSVMFSQLFFIIYYSIMYMMSYKIAHRFIAYLEEEAIKTYSTIIKDIDEGKLPIWKEQSAPKEAIEYWSFSPDAKMRDVFIAIRADEVSHKEFNHRFADMQKNEEMIKHKIYFQEEIKNNEEN
jgi:hypothetical protein